MNLANDSQSFCFTMAAKIKAINIKAINIAPITDWESTKVGSELSVVVRGRPSKYASKSPPIYTVKKMPPKIAPTP